MNKFITKVRDINNIWFLIVIIAILALLSLAMMNLFNDGHQEAVPLTRVENGGILDLDMLPENVELPNGVVMKDVSIYKDGNQDIISSKVDISEDQELGFLKITWLDGQQRKIGHSYASMKTSAETSRLKFWALPGSEKVQIEIA